MAYNSLLDSQGLTLVDVLRDRATIHPRRTAFTILSQSESSEATITFEELDRRARAIAAFLEESGISGERALLLLPSGLEYITAFFGCLYAGVVAVPSFPVHFGRLRKEASWFRSMVADARPLVAFAMPDLIKRASKEAEHEQSIAMLRWISPQSIEDARGHDWKGSRPCLDAIAVLQYTSGSTSTPKGVMISHGNIMQNQAVIHTACETDQESTIVSWLPFYHDMGLVGTILQPIYLGAHSVLMAPTTFLQNPVRWLRAISVYRGHSSTGPNFAYELCCRKITAEQKVGLDLKSWRIAVNGAEPVRAETMERFASAFSECGFRAEAFLPSYGLAESTLMVTGARNARLPRTMRVSTRALEQNMVQKGSEEGDTRNLVGCGIALPGHEIQIVNPETLEPCSEGVVGEIWVNSPSVGQGYWNKPEETALTFRAQLKSGGDATFLRTGDLGFLAEDQLFVTGRIKDLIILRGRNLYPQDIELTVQSCGPSLRSEAGAAFVVDVDGEDALVVIHELQRHAEANPETLLSTIREAVLFDHGIQIYAVILTRSDTLPKTSSGKIRRRDCRDLYLKGELEIVASRAYPQLTDVAVDIPTLSSIDMLQTQPALRAGMVDSYLRSQLAAMLKVSSEEIVADLPLPALGIDSVLAVKVANIIENLSGARVDTVDILEGCTLDDLVATVCERISTTDETRSLQKRVTGKAYPLSYGQRGLWFLHQRAPESTAYTLASAGRVRGLNVNSLRQAFAGVLVRHPMLRAIFPAQAQAPVQFVQSMEQVSLDRHFQYSDISSMQPERLQSLLAEEAQRPFTLDKEPPVRLKVFQCGSREHVLLLTLHHIIADMWSIGIILQELGSLYSNGEIRKELPQERLDYLGFVEWQAKTMNGPEAKALQEFWLNQLKGELPVLQLPADHPRPLAQSYRGSSEPVRLDCELYAALKQIGRAQNATPFMVFIAAFQVLLHRICGQDDVLLGSPTSGRSQSAFSDVVGYFVNPVVTRSRYDAAMSFLAFLASGRRALLEVFKHQDYPFSLLVEDLHIQAMPGISPVFQAMFVWQRAYGGQAEALAPMALGVEGISMELAGLPVESIKLESTGSQFDLTLMMAENGPEVLGLFKYSTDLFDAVTIQNLAARLKVLLQEIAIDPFRPISTLPLMADAERKQLIQEWSAGQFGASVGESCIHELFEQVATQHPEAISLIVGGRQLNYSQLNEQANQFARHLRGLGVCSEIRVGLCLERSVELIVALLAVWKAGGAYVPFDVHDPKGRLSSLIQQSGVQVLITHEQLLGRLPEQLPELVLLDLDLEIIGLESSANPCLPVPPASLAYMIYTSGSTGEPKGVMIEHKSLLNLRAGLKRAIYDAWKQQPLRVGLNAPLAFDSSIKQLLTLTLGHTLCLVPQEVRRNGTALLAWIRELHVEVLDCTPTQLKLLLDAGFSDSDRVMLLVGGEPVPAEIWDALTHHKAAPSYNVYGPTECTVDATACRISPESGPSIGRSLRGTKVYLLDEHMEPVPAGVPGEMFIGGPSVGRGYLARPDVTAGTFLPDPFSIADGARMYRTGDRARYFSDGKLQFLGRADRQVKIRGFRIELGEIETALRECDDVQDAAVVVRKTAGGSAQLVAYIVTTVVRDSNEYRQRLAQKLPEYMVPVVAATIPRIPTNANGKRDYTALPVLDVAVAEPRAGYVPPQSPIESHLAKLWADMLRIQPIGVNDNFFTLGGDSLQATKLITRVQESYPTDSPLLASFFREPTIKALAQLVATPPHDGISRLEQ